jgi:hypothetical protein
MALPLERNQPDLYPGGNENVSGKGYRDPFAQGTIGSEEGKDPMLPAPQRVDTKPFEEGETRDSQCYGAEYIQSEVGRPVELVRYNNLDHQARVAAMPHAAQDEALLRYGIADPLMTDHEGSLPAPGSGVAEGKDLFGENKDGALHNSPAHPGFAAVQRHIEGEGYSARAAGAILASKTRHASKAAHKANPRLNRVKG